MQINLDTLIEAVNNCNWYTERYKKASKKWYKLFGVIGGGSLIIIALGAGLGLYFFVCHRCHFGALSRICRYIFIYILHEQK